MPLVVAEHLTKTFTGEDGAAISALSDLSLEIAEHEFLVIAGPSGSGKTTFLRLLAGLETPSSGRLSIAGRSMAGVPPREREVAMVFQTPALFPHLTARENIGFGLKIRKTASKEIAERVSRAAALLGISDGLERRPEFLSGGERQRVALGRIIVQRPKLVLFDEPLSNLDAPLRSRMRMELVRLHKELGWTSIYVTHDQGEAMSLATKLVVLKGGALQQAGMPLEVYRRPANVFVAQFVGAPGMNIVPIDECRACGVRPEDLRAAPGESREFSITGVVEFVENFGAETHIHVRAGEDRVIWRVPAGERAGRIGEELKLAPKPGTAVFFDRASGKRVED